jgi:radical SAM protein with 4Fe4S-binding SPASM domain
MIGMTKLLTDALRQQVPISVQFELTNRCNEDCQHCYVDLGDVHDELSTAEVLSILGQLQAMGTLFLTFTGGEIFTRKDLLTLARQARAMGFALRLFSNGTLINETIADEIAAIGVVAVELSLYSMNPEEHDRITRIPGSHERTLRAARLLRERQVHTVVKAPIMAGLTREYQQVIGFARSIGAEYRFDPTLVVRYDLDDTPLAHRMNRADLLGVCVDPHLGLAVAPASGETPNADQAICATARRVALISARGLVYPCSQRFPPAGSLREQSFREIWEQSPLLQRLRNLTAQDLPTCSGCHNNSFCGRCSLDALFEDGDFFGPNSWACTQAEVRQEAFARGGQTTEAMLKQRFGDRQVVCDLG